jgi:hypothetical protein
MGTVFVVSRDDVFKIPEEQLAHYTTPIDIRYQEVKKTNNDTKVIKITKFSSKSNFSRVTETGIYHITPLPNGRYTIYNTSNLYIDDNDGKPYAVNEIQLHR